MSKQIVLPDPLNKTKPDSIPASFIAYVEDAKLWNLWKEGDTSIPLAHFVGNFEVYYTTQGSQGKLDAASKQQLENSFSTKDKEEVLKKILREGTDKSTKNVGKDGSSTNDSQGGNFTVSKGSNAGGGGHGGR